jgi:hypothetical protein
MVEISIDPTVQVLSRSRISRVSTPCSVDSKSAKFQSLATCPMIRRSRSDLESTDHIRSYRDFDILVAKCFDTPTSGIRNPEMGLDQRSTSNLDLTAQIISISISISAFLWYCFLTLQVAIRETRNGVFDML